MTDAQLPDGALPCIDTVPTIGGISVLDANATLVDAGVASVVLKD